MHHEKRDTNYMRTVWFCNVISVTLECVLCYFFEQGWKSFWTGKSYKIDFVAKNLTRRFFAFETWCVNQLKCVPKQRETLLSLKMGSHDTLFLTCLHTFNDNVLSSCWWHILIVCAFVHASMFLYIDHVYMHTLVYGFIYMQIHYKNTPQEKHNTILTNGTISSACA